MSPNSPFVKNLSRSPSWEIRQIWRISNLQGQSFDDGMPEAIVRSWKCLGRFGSRCRHGIAWRCLGRLGNCWQSAAVMELLGIAAGRGDAWAALETAAVMELLAYAWAVLGTAGNRLRSWNCLVTLPDVGMPGPFCKPLPYGIAWRCLGHLGNCWQSAAVMELLGDISANVPCQGLLGDLSPSVP